MIPRPTPPPQFLSDPIGAAQSARLSAAGMAIIGPTSALKYGMPGDLSTTSYADLGPLQGDFVRVRSTGAKNAAKNSPDAMTALPSTRGGSSGTFGEFEV